MDTLDRVRRLAKTCLNISISLARFTTYACVRFIEHHGITNNDMHVRVFDHIAKM